MRGREAVALLRLREDRPGEGRTVKHLLWAITAAYFVQRHASGDEWPALMWAAIFGYEAAAFVAWKWPKHFAE
jgi:hypothetical protein